MRVTALIENEAPADRDDLVAEFGLSLHIQTGSLNILFDSGASGAFAANAAVLGVDLSAVDLAVLSHQHSDHGGGLARFFDLNSTAPVLLRDSVVEPRFSKALAILRRPIGLDRSVVARWRDRLRFIAEDTEVAPGVWLLTEIGESHPRPKGNRMLFVDRGGRLERDRFEHELVMVVIEPDGLAVFSGCSHQGILNMIDAAVARFPDTPVKAVFGGFHLKGLPQLDTMAASRDGVRDVGRAMLDRVAGTVHTGHCTGRKGFCVLKSVMGDALQPLSTGTTVRV